MWSMPSAGAVTGGTVDLHLESPPEVVSLGIGVHGIGDRVERWMLPDLWAVHIYDYVAELEVAGVTHRLHPGSMSVIAAGSPMEFRMTGVSEHVYVHLRPVAEGVPTSVPVVQDLGDAAAELRSRLRRASELRAPRHRAAEVWSVLWSATQVSRRTRQGDAGVHPAVLAAMRHIDGNLSHPLPVPDIAERAFVSVSHLNRLFNRDHGCGVSAYVRDRRSERAHHLLTQTTQPITSVAASVGIADLQAFNKLCRARFGRSPRDLRRAAALRRDDRA